MWEDKHKNNSKLPSHIEREEKKDSNDGMQGIDETAAANRFSSIYLKNIYNKWFFIIIFY